MIRLLLIGFHVVVCSTIIAQQQKQYQVAIGWNYMEGNNYNKMSGSITYDGGHILVGSIGGTSSPYTDLMLVKVGNNEHVDWVKLYDSYSSHNYGNAVIQTADSGYLAVGSTINTDSTGTNIFVVKTNKHGDVQWAKDYGDIASNYGQEVVELPVGGYLISTTDGDKYTLMRITISGGLEWSKVFGVNSYSSSSMVVLGDSSVVVAGTYSGYVLVSRIDIDGNVIWAKRYGGNYNDRGTDIALTPDSNLVVVGYTASFGMGMNDYYVLKLDKQGSIIWTRAFGGIGDDRAYAVDASKNNQYVIVGTRSSGAFVYAIAVDSTGSLLWNKVYGDTNIEQGSGIIAMDDGGYLITGETSSFGNGWMDHYLIKTDSIGNSICNSNSVNTYESNTFTATVPAPPPFNYPIQTYSDTITTFNIAPKLVWTVICSNLFMVDITSVKATCTDTCNGTANSVIVNGTPPFQYNWSNGDTASMATGLCRGTYYLTVVDAIQDTAINSVLIDAAPDQMSLVTNIISYDNGSCSGSASVVVVFGGFPFLYQWNDPNNQTTKTATGLCEGVYEVVVTDGKLCIDTAMVFIYATGVDNSKMSIENEVHPNPFTTSTTLSIEGSALGATFYLYDQLGRQVKSVAITQSETILQRDDLPAGIYFYRLTNREHQLGTGKLVVLD